VNVSISSGDFEMTLSEELEQVRESFVALRWAAIEASHFENSLWWMFVTAALCIMLEDA
jgi:hypothetical protein